MQSKSIREVVPEDVDDAQCAYRMSLPLSRALSRGGKRGEIDRQQLQRGLAPPLALGRSHRHQADRHQVALVADRALARLLSEELAQAGDDLDVDPLEVDVERPRQRISAARDVREIVLDALDADGVEHLAIA